MRKEYDFSKGTRGNPVMVRKGKKDPQYYELFLEIAGEFPGIEVMTGFHYDKTRLCDYYLIGPAHYAEIEEKARMLSELLVRKADILQNSYIERPAPMMVIRAASPKVLKENNL